MAAARKCKKCGGEMEFRLGNYECVDCGAVEAPPPPVSDEPGPRRLKGLSSHSNLDPGAAYKLINPELSDTPQLIEELQPKYGPKARREESKSDPLRDERYVCIGLALAATIFNVYTLLFTESGMTNVELLTGQMTFLPDPQTFSNIFIAVCVAGLVFFAGGVLLKEMWLKWLAVLIVTGVFLTTALGLMTPGITQTICNSLQGWIAIIVGLWLLIFFSRDIPNTATGDDAM